MNDQYDAVVIGLGIMGSAALWRLAGSGARVLGVEAFGPRHTLGSPHGSTRIFRRAYWEGGYWITADTDLDQGREMSRHKELTAATKVAVYFCDPHSPWQRGSNENINGLVRQYLPKGTDLSGYSQEQLDATADEINNRPRIGLGVRSPLAVYRELTLPRFHVHQEVGNLICTENRNARKQPAQAAVHARVQDRGDQAGRVDRRP